MLEIGCFSEVEFYVIAFLHPLKATLEEKIAGILQFLILRYCHCYCYGYDYHHPRTIKWECLYDKPFDDKECREILGF